MAPSTPKDKGVVGSANLLSMKFMQRAAAADSQPETPASEPSSKRRKVLDGSARSLPATRVDAEAVRAAVAEVEAKRQAAMEQQTADEHWVLDDAKVAAMSEEVIRRSGTTERPTLRVEYVSRNWIDYAEPDQDPSTFKYEVVHGRFKTKNYKPKARPESDSSDDDSDEEADDPRDDAATTKQKKKAPASLGKNKNSAVKLSELSAISGSGGKAGPASKKTGPQGNCYNCNNPGHIARDCPKQRAAPQHPGGLSKNKRRHNESR